MALRKKRIFKIISVTAGIVILSDTWVYAASKSHAIDKKNIMVAAAVSLAVRTFILVVERCIKNCHVLVKPGTEKCRIPRTKPSPMDRKNIKTADPIMTS